MTTTTEIDAALKSWSALAAAVDAETSRVQRAGRAANVEALQKLLDRRSAAKKVLDALVWEHARATCGDEAALDASSFLARLARPAVTTAEIEREIARAHEEA